MFGKYNLTLEHVKAHTAGNDEKSLRNQRADNQAQLAHVDPNVHIRFPTLALPRWAILDDTTWWEGSIAVHMNDALINRQLSHLPPAAQRNITLLNQTWPAGPDRKPYEKAISSGAAKFLRTPPPRARPTFRVTHPRTAGTGGDFPPGYHRIARLTGSGPPPSP